MKNRFPAAGALISRLFALAIAGGPATVDAQLPGSGCSTLCCDNCCEDLFAFKRIVTNGSPNNSELPLNSNCIIGQCDGCAEEDELALARSRTATDVADAVRLGRLDDILRLARERKEVIFNP